MADALKKQNTFSVTIEYLREIVAKQTFRDSPAAALRELIQNAHDACLVRSARFGIDNLSVHITLDSVEKTITIDDDGIGMSLSDIHEYLTTVGRGTKGSRLTDRYDIPVRNAKRLENVIGEFGFGFIAAFIIADDIEVRTRSAEEGSRTVVCRFSSEAVSYEAAEVTDQSPIGTRLVLHLNRKTLSRGLRPTDDATEGSILSWDTVDAIVRKYCIFLEFEIYVALKGDPTTQPSNQIEVPWRAETRLSEAVQRFYEARFGKNKLGEVLHSIPLTLSKERGDAVTVEGLLFIENTPTTEEGSGNLEVFIKRMWVCERQQKLLPAWASFLRGLIVTPDLRPMPGRDSVDQQQEGFDKVARALREVVCSAFLSLARTNPRTFNNITSVHGRAFRWGLSGEKDRAREERREYSEAELLRFVQFVRYSRKHMAGHLGNINELLDISPTVPLEFKDRKRIVNFVARPVPPDRQFEFRKLLTSGNLEVIVPNDESELAVLHCINETFSDVIFKNVELDLLRTDAGLLEGQARDPWVPFIKYFQALARDHRMAGAEVGDMEPDYMPAIVLNVPVSNDESTPTTEQDSSPVPPPVIPGLPPDVAKFYNQTLVINSRNPTMKLMLEYKQSAKIDGVDDVLAVCLHECYHMALESALDAFPADMTRHHADVSCRILENYVKSHKERLGDAAAAQEAQEELETLRRNSKEQLASLTRERDAYRACYGEVCTTGEHLFVPATPEERMAAVVFCDLIGSTGSVVGMDFTERGIVLNDFVKLAEEEVERQKGFFDKFTGDGLIALFGIERARKSDGGFDANDWQEAASRAWKFGTQIQAAMASFNLRPEIQKVIQKNYPKVRDFELRIGISAGLVFFGRFGGRGTAVGLPVIVAARLCSEKGAYAKAHDPILADDQFRKRCPDVNFEPVDYDFVPRGIDVRVPIFKARPPV